MSDYHTMRRYLSYFAVGMLLAAPGAALAQAPRVAPAAATPLAREPGARDLQMPPIDLIELGQYAGWGGTIGAGLGLAYGLAFEHGNLKRLEVAADTLIGFTAGLVAGTVIYVATLALKR